MADLFWTEFGGVDHARVPGNVDNSGIAPVANGWLASGNLTLSGTSQQSAAFNASAHLIRVSAATACVITIGANPDASTGVVAYMPAGSVDYFAVQPGQKLAAKTP